MFYVVSCSWSVVKADSHHNFSSQLTITKPVKSEYNHSNAKQLCTNSPNIHTVAVIGSIVLRQVPYPSRLHQNGQNLNSQTIKPDRKQEVFKTIILAKILKPEADIRGMGLVDSKEIKAFLYGAVFQPLKASPFHLRTGAYVYVHSMWGTIAALRCLLVA